MAIKARNAGRNENNIIDLSKPLQSGDMLYFNADRNLFEGKPGVSKLSELNNDANFVTLLDMQTAIAQSATGGNIDLSSYATDAEVTQKLTPYATRDYVDGRFAGLTDEDRQTLSIVGNTLSISNGNSVDLDTALQSLSLSGSVLSITEGNSVDLDGLIGNLVTDSQISNYYTRSEVDGLIPTVPTSTRELTNDSGYITESYVQTELSNYQPTIDLTSYYTKTEVDALIPVSFSGSYNDLTDTPAIPDLTGYATEAYVTQQIANLNDGGDVDLSGYVTTVDLNNAIAGVSTFSGDYNDLTNKPVLFSGSYNDLTDIPSAIDLSGYALKTELFSGDYSDLTNAPTIPSLDGYATETYVQGELANYQPTIDLTSYYTKAEVDGLIPTTFSGSYLDLTDTPASVDLTPYALKTELPDVTAYLTESEIDTKIAAAATGDIDLTNYYTKSEVDNSLASITNNVATLQANQFSGDYNDLANTPTIPDVTGLATEAYVDSRTFSGQWNDIIGKPTIFSGNYNDLINQPNLGQYATNTSVNGLIANYYNKTEIDTLVPSDISDLTDTSGLLNGGGSVDLTGYATETYVQQQISSASLGTIANLNDINDVAVGSLPQVDRSDEYYLLEYNPVNELWESRNFGNIFATQQYVTDTVATIISDGEISLDGYVTEQFLEQKLLERGHHFSGDYNDLANTPILFSGDYRDLINAPADNSDLRLALDGNQLQLLNIEPEPDTVISTINLDDLGAAVSSHIDYNQVNNLPNIFSGNYNDLVNRPNLFSGNYNDLANKPYIPSIAGLATQQYVDDRWSEPTRTGERTFTDGVIFEDFTQQKLSTINATASRRDMVLAVQTTNNIETEVLLNDGSRVDILENTTAMFKATVVATSNANNAAFTVRGVVTRITSGISIIGTNIVETISDNEQGWLADLSADTVNNSLKITVTGGESTTIDWTVFLEISEVIR